MKVIRPVTITDAMLISSTAAEPSGGDPAVYSGATTYSLDQLVYLASTHRIYKSLQGSNTGHSPDVSPTWWSDYAPTNRWAMFDNEVNTQTSVTSPLTVTIAPGVVNSLALIELVGSEATITMTDGAGGPTVYSTTIDLDDPTLGDWFAWFFDPYTQRTVVVLTDLPAYSNGRITVTITGSGTVKCGGLIVGTLNDLGATQYGVQAGIRDYSKKVTDAAGATALSVGKFAKTMRAQFRVANGSVSAVHQALTNLRATPCVWIGEDSGDYEPLIVFGWFRDFSLTIDFPSASIYTLEVEGLT